MKLYLLMCGYTVMLHTYQHIHDKHGKSQIQDWTCTATWVSPDKLLTAGHCVDETTGQKWVLDWDVEHLQVKVIATDYAEDMALLQTVKPTKHGYAHLGDRARLLNPVYMTSFESDVAYAYGEGKVVGLWEDTDLSSHPFIASNIPSEAGSSGAAWFNEKGEIVALQVRTDKIGSYAVDQPLLKQFLTSHGIK